MDQSERAEPGGHEILEASGPGPEQVEVGMQVVSIDGQRIGRVKEVRPGDFLVDRPLARDVYVPYRFIVATPDQWEQYRGGPPQPTEIVLNVTAAHIDQQHWQTP